MTDLYDTDEQPQVDNGLRAAALMELLRRQQQEQAGMRAQAQAQLGAAQRQAGGLNGLALITSMGANPLLQGVQREAARQGAAVEPAALERLRALGGGKMMDPLAIERMRQGDEREARLAKMAADLEKHRQALEEARKGKAAADAGKAAKKDEKDLITLETNLRKEFQATPAYKNWGLASVAFDQVTKAAKNPSPAGDIALITNYMRSLDPSTGVKEQEFQNASSAGGFDDRARAGWERLMSGQRLTPEQRADFVESARANTLAFKQPYDQARGHYQGLASTYGVDPERVAAAIGMDLKEGASTPRAAPASPPNLDLEAPNPPTPKVSGTDRLRKMGKKAPAAPQVMKKQYSKSRNRTRELDAAGNVVREYEGPPNG